jgi:hypothetical protein
VLAADTERLAITPDQVVRQRVRVKQTRWPAAEEHVARLDSWRSTKSTYWNSGGDPVNTELQNRYQVKTRFHSSGKALRTCKALHSSCRLRCSRPIFFESWCAQMPSAHLLRSLISRPGFRDLFEALTIAIMSPTLDQEIL